MGCWELELATSRHLVDLLVSAMCIPMALSIEVYKKQKSDKWIYITLLKKKSYSLSDYQKDHTLSGVNILLYRCMSVTAALQIVGNHGKENWLLTK